MYDYVLFDLDGTLTNPELGITNCVMYALEKFGIKVDSRKKLHPFIGPPIKHSFQYFYGFSEEESTLAVAYFRERFSQIGWRENEIFEGIAEVLQELKKRNKKIILASCKLEEYSIRILKHFQIEQYFDFIAGSTMDGRRSEKEDVIAYALEQCKIQDKSKVIMVGDRKYDIVGANINGIDSMGVLFGFGDYEELKAAKATIIVKEVEEILRYIR